MQWTLPVRTTVASNATKTCLPSGKAGEAIFSDRNGKSFCFFDGSRMKSGQLPVTLVLSATLLCKLFPRFSRFQAVIHVFVPDNVHVCRCLLLFQNVWAENCARLIVKCRITGNWEEVYHSSTIIQLDIKCARELHLDTWDHNVYQIELLPSSQFPSF